MRFSDRTGWDRSPNDLAQLLTGDTAPGIACDLTESNPTRTGLGATGDALAAALADAGNAAYEPDPLGARPAREAVSRWYSARGVTADVARLVLATSTSEAYAWLFKLACDPGDAILVPTPSYPLFEHLAQLEGVELHAYPMRLDRRWEIDVDALAAALPEHARALVVVSPNNPTGSCPSPEELRALARLAASRDLLLIADEVFADFPWRGAPRHAEILAHARDAGAVAAVLSGLSKACGLPQMKLGWMLLGGRDEGVAEAMARLELVADTYLSVGTPVQRALPRLLELGAEFADRARARLAANLVTLGSCGLRHLPADGGWCAVVPLPDGTDEQQVVQHLAGDGVLVQPGWLFDLPEGHVVVSLIVEPRTFARGLRQLASLLAAIESGEARG